MEGLISHHLAERFGEVFIFRWHGGLFDAYNAELLKYLCDNNIRSLDELQTIVNNSDEKYREQKAITDNLKKRFEYLSENISEENTPFYEDVKHRLEAEEAKLKAFAQDRKKAGDIYRTYLLQTGNNLNYAGTDIGNKNISDTNESSIPREQHTKV